MVRPILIVAALLTLVVLLAGCGTYIKIDLGWKRKPAPQTTNIIVQERRRPVPQPIILPAFGS